jgi:hypothetical protein
VPPHGSTKLPPSKKSSTKPLGRRNTFLELCGNATLDALYMWTRGAQEAKAGKREDAIRRPPWWCREEQTAGARRGGGFRDIWRQKNTLYGEVGRTRLLQLWERWTQLVHYHRGGGHPRERGSPTPIGWEGEVLPVRETGNQDQETIGEYRIWWGLQDQTATATGMQLVCRHRGERKIGWAGLKEILYFSAPPKALNTWTGLLAHIV